MAKEKRTRYAILGTLSRGAASGYDIKKTMENTTEYFWHESDSSIYPELKRLLSEGMVSCEERKTQGSRLKKIYQITDAGREQLHEWLLEEPVIFNPRNELMLKVFFGFNVDPSVTVEHLQVFRLRVQQRLRTQRRCQQELEASELKGERLSRYLTLKAGVHFTQAQLKWIDEALELLNGG
ncbi:PadR family transcriptional regulator [Dongshaea marina]|uniref:PadR family transcriptional regulator n=1 Tax=Dongshaea marina TaxID=2047966 RepID=UPI000D3EDEC0|nr:PadR family transcriptional regulator [Dongshaea marina]